MKAFTLHLSRLYSLTKAGLALFGLAALLAVMTLPSERHLLRTTLPEVISGTTEAATAGGADSGTVEPLQEREHVFLIIGQRLNELLIQHNGIHIVFWIHRAPLLTVLPSCTIKRNIGAAAIFGLVDSSA